MVGISTDGEASQQVSTERHALPFILVSDEGGAVSRVDDATALFGLMIGRVTFVFDASGVVQHVLTSMFNAAKHVSEALRVVEQLQQKGAARSQIGAVSS